MILRLSSIVGLTLCLAACDPSPGRSSTIQPDQPPVPETVLPDILLPETVSFNEHIQPILSEYCYHCHGPDSKTRAPEDAPLRLDLPEDAFALREDGHPVIIKGNPAESNLIKRIVSGDPDTIMPPPESHKTLNAGEIALLNRWIEQGAEYEAHWAFVPIEKTEPPAAGGDWAANPIDRFIAEKLDAAGLKPNPPDDPRRFHRRLTLDLTGLPPAARGNRRVSNRLHGRRANRRRSRGRPPARHPRQRRALRSSLARCRALCGHPRHPY